MSILIFLIIIIIISIIILFIYITRKICIVEPESFIYDSKINGPTITIIGTTHGNEPVGYHAIKELINRLNTKDIILKKGKIILIPIVNYCGFRLNTRNSILYGDINRMYKKNTTSIINKTILKYAEQSDFLLDFHEGWGYHGNSSSIGSTITPSLTYDSKQIALIMKDMVNRTITSDMKKFIIRTDDSELLKNKQDYMIKTNMSGTLSTYMENNKKNYILIEITGQNSIQPLELRIAQGSIFIESVLSYYQII